MDWVVLYFVVLAVPSWFNSPRIPLALLASWAVQIESR
jgi:hypothetical protein